MPFSDIGQMQQDEEGNVTGGMDAQSPVIHALMLAQAHGRLQGLADLARSTLMRRGGVGGPKGINPTAVMRSPQGEGQLPSLAELHAQVPMRGQPSSRGPEVTRALNRQSMNTPQDMPISGSPRDVTMESSSSHGLPTSQTLGSTAEARAGSATQGLQRTAGGNPQSHLQALQDLLNRIFMTQSRQ